MIREARGDDDNNIEQDRLIDKWGKTPNYPLYLGQGSDKVNKIVHIPREHMEILEHMDYVFWCGCGCGKFFLNEGNYVGEKKHKELLAFLETLGECIGTKIEILSD